MFQLKKTQTFCFQNLEHLILEIIRNLMLAVIAAILARDG